MKSTAHFGEDRAYRYTLWRIWGGGKRYVQFVGLNPSTADEVNNDPTVTRCVNYAKAWGFDGMCMTNIFAFRATDPQDMYACEKPVGALNDLWLKRCARKCELVVCAWGNHGQHMDRGRKVVKVLQRVTDLHILGLNANGSPKHPLYLKADLKPVLWKKNKRRKHAN